MNKKILSIVLFALGASMGTFYAQSCISKLPNYSELNLRNFFAISKNKALYEKAIKELKEACESKPVSNCNNEPSVSKDSHSSSFSTPSSGNCLYIDGALKLLEAAQKFMGWTADANLSLTCLEVYKNNECTESLNEVLALYFAYLTWFEANGQPEPCNEFGSPSDMIRIQYTMTNLLLK